MYIYYTFGYPPPPPGMIGTGSEGELGLTGIELVLHSPLALQGIMTPSGVFEGPRSHTFHSAL